MVCIYIVLAFPSQTHLCPLLQVACSPYNVSRPNNINASFVMVGIIIKHTQIFTQQLITQTVHLPIMIFAVYCKSLIFSTKIENGIDCA